jgi:peptidoglycan/LPS O-acetylase OafA/YrhL
MTGPGDERNNQLDGLRGYAALAVVFYHSILGLDLTLIGRVLYKPLAEIDGAYERAAKIVVTILSGQTAVIIFFILSGAVLFDSLQREKGGLPAISARFLVKRFFRIYPVLLICLLVCWIAFSMAGIPRSLNQLVQNLALYDNTMNGATWTLNAEAFGSVFLLCAYIGYRTLREAGIVLVGGIFACANLAAFQDYLVYFKPYLYCFAAGMFIPTRLGRLAIGLFLPSRSWPILVLAMLFMHDTHQETMAALLVGLVYYRKAGALGGFLSRPVSVFLGRISYSFYLFNVVFMEIILHRLRDVPVAVSHPVEFGLAAAIVVIVLTIPVAYWSMRFIEKPSIWLGRRLTRGRGGNISVPGDAPAAVQANAIALEGE